MNCPHCGMPEIQDTEDKKIWHKWECGNIILWPTDGSSKSKGAHTPACREIARLKDRVSVLEEENKAYRGVVYALTHGKG